MASEFRSITGAVTIRTPTPVRSGDCLRTYAVTRAAPPRVHTRARMQVPRRGGRESHRSPNPGSSALASERLVDLAPGPTGNNGADWRLRLETTLILETSVSANSRRLFPLTIVSNVKATFEWPAVGERSVPGPIVNFCHLL
jgi:hypothetical protein